MSVLLTLCLALPGAAGAETFVDDSGQTIRVTRPFRRIISLYGAHTENLFSLGLDAEIIGVSRHESYPQAALAKPVFSHRDNPERFMAADPDLVLVRPMIYMGHRPLINRLRASGITVVSLQPAGVKQMLAYWQRLGLLTGREARAEQMIVRFKAGLAKLQARVAHIPPQRRVRVYFESIHSRMKTFTPGSMAAFALRTAGGINVAANAEGRRGTNIAPYGKERILSHAAEIDVFLAQQGTMNKVSVTVIKGESGFSAIKAVRDGRVYLVDERIVSRPTLRLLKGIAVIQELLYPDLAPKTVKED